MKIKWLGHAAFLITAKDGTKIITDPYKSGSFSGALSYPPIKETADIVTISHEHEDHNYVRSIPSQPQVVREIGTRIIKNVKIEGITTCHDTLQGRERGLNTVYIITVDNLRVCHLGDLGALPTEAERQKIGKVDVLLIPVGGVFTIDAEAATKVTTMLNPRIAIPMHYKTAHCAFPIAPVEDFIKDKKLVKRIESSEVEVFEKSLPQATEIWVLQYQI
ncbi:MAG: MBL fold metallo-hydrolase [candidate division WOR-3 bacterium]